MLSPKIQDSGETANAGKFLTSEGPRSRVNLAVNWVVSLTVLGGCLYGYTILGERKRPDRSKSPKSPVTIVETQPLVPHVGPVLLESNGVVVPLREIRLATEVAGRIVEQSENLRPGRMVDAGEILIRLDSAEYDLEVQRLQAQFEQESAEANSLLVGMRNTEGLIELAQQQVQLAQDERERMTALISSNTTSASEVDVAKRAELTAKSSLIELENRHRELESECELIAEKQAVTEVLLRRAKLDLTRCTVKSPMHGRVVASSVEVQSFVLAGTSFATIEDLSSVEVRSNLTANQMAWIWRSSHEVAADRVPPLTATISWSLGGETYRWPAVLQRIDGAGIDQQTRTYPCLFQVEQPETLESKSNQQSLTRGMFVAVTINAVPDRTLYRVPENAIRPGNRIWFNVLGKLRIVSVTVVSRETDSVTVELNRALYQSFNLQEADLSKVDVIVSPISDPVDGLPVGSGDNQREPISRNGDPPDDLGPNKIKDPMLAPKASEDAQVTK